MSSLEEYIVKLGLKKHPEGGYYRETYRSLQKVISNNNERSASTAIYFLIGGKAKSHFHRLASDEVWHFYDGSPLKVVEIDLNGNLNETIIGKDLHSGELFQYTVKAGHWFASCSLGSFSLVGCTVSPGFEFSDFEMAKKDHLLNNFPEHQKVIEQFSLV